MLESDIKQFKSLYNQICERIVEVCQIADPIHVKYFPHRWNPFCVYQVSHLDMNSTDVLFTDQDGDENRILFQILLMTNEEVADYFEARLSAEFKEENEKKNKQSQQEKEVDLKQLKYLKAKYPKEFEEVAKS